MIHTRRRLGIACTLLITLSYSVFVFVRPTTQIHSKWPRADVADPATVNQAHLHVLVPASEPNENLCKTLLSLAVLGYPSPVIINWNSTFDDPGLVEGGSHLAKITGVDEYLQSLTDGHDEDLVLMIDGYDVWMQLRPQTLIDRYFEINKRANARIQAEQGSLVAGKYGVRQEIIFGCQKRCWPWTFDDPPCYAVPNSSLPHDIFGLRTDEPSDEGQRPFVNNRPRFLVSGTAIGTVRAFRKLFRQAVKQLEAEPNFGSDQYILSHIFGDQEIWREAVRRDSRSRSSQHDLSFNPQHIEEVRRKASSLPDGGWEFGIGIDYRSEIVLNTVFAEDDTAWLKPNDEQEFAQLQEEHHVPFKYRTTFNVSLDISNTLPPYWTFTVEDLLRWTEWRDVPLLTNIYTGIQPAVIHHNAHIDGLKSRRETWWPLVWFQSHARDLLDAHIYAPITPFAYSGHTRDVRTEYWPYEIWKGGARNGPAVVGKPGDGWIRFDEICSNYHEEVFQDGKGPWQLPDAH